MAIDGEPKGAAALIQARPAAARLTVLIGLVWLTGCSTPRNTGPEAWWHDMSGGKIAEQRPPPPGDNDPYPSLATVPPRPARPDVAGWNRVTAGLIDNRISARQAEALNPLPPPAKGPPSAQGAGRRGGGPEGTRPTAARPEGARPEGTMEASLGAPEAKPTAAARAAAPARAAVARGGTAPLPALPAAEPPRPAIAPAPRPPAPTPAAAPPAPRPAEGTPIDFEARSAALRDAGLTLVQQIAARHGERGIAITGYGEASRSDPLGQSAALDLALRRARAVATALVAEGVAVRFLRLNAEAAGRGAAVRLLE